MVQTSEEVSWLQLKAKQLNTMKTRNRNIGEKSVAYFFPSCCLYRCQKFEFLVVKYCVGNGTHFGQDDESTVAPCCVV